MLQKCGKLYLNNTYLEKHKFSYFIGSAFVH